MPGAARLLDEEEAARDSDAPPPKAEAIKLWMPSEMEPSDREAGCVRGLPKMEAKLRTSQCLNALITLRSRLHSKRFFIGFRYSNIQGQVHGTKANTLQAQLGERVTAAAEKYRVGRAALLRLEGAAMDPQFRPLTEGDLQLDGDDGESDLASKKKLAMLGSGRGARAPRMAPGTSRKVMSWIWTAQGGANEGEEALHNSVRVEWCRARARKLRWEEEVWLCREEMRRVLRYLHWQARWWEDRVAARPDASPEVQAGVRAYALKQSAMHLRLASHFAEVWRTPTHDMTRRVLAGEPDDDLEGAQLDEFFQV
ncbi:hypothetical protein DFH06DRAFT_1024912 [Mycena polygramma]|nr:hypothetical protein DFH06DRAFT_1024912 [Mycena polygramma]